MSEKKSVIEEALLEASQIEKIFKKQVKETLQSQMKEEINQLVKESLVTELDDEENTDTENDETPKLDVDMGDVETDVEDSDATETEPSLEPTLDTEETPAIDVSSELTDLDSEESPSIEDAEVSDDEVMDLSSMSDEEVIKVFKRMTSEDEIEVHQDGGDISLVDGDEEYLIRTESEDLDESDLVYEIELSEDEDEVITNDSDEKLNLLFGSDEVPETQEESVYEIEEIDLDEMDDLDEASRTHSMGRKMVSKPQTFPNNLKRPAERTNESVVLKKNLSKVLNENRKLKEKLVKFESLNEEYKNALNHFRTKLNEVAVFNSNFAHIVRLFTESSTTKQEKFDIIKRFDGIKDLKESKNLYKQILNEMKTKPTSQNIVENLDKQLQSGTSKQLIEETVYRDPQTERMKQLMNFKFTK
jgi:hypothetical protein